VKNNLCWTAIVAGLLAPLAIASSPQLKYVVILSRHGVRSPTWDRERLAQYSAQPWPDWGVPPGYLTPHGRELITILGAYYREWLNREQLLHGKGCGDKGRVYIWADTDQRTLETGRALSESILPGCAVPVNSRGDGIKDTIFSGVPGADPQIALKDVRLRLGADPQALLAAHRTSLETLQSILDGGQPTPKKLLPNPAEVGVGLQGKTIELTGPFAVASTMSENLLLEYANGMAPADLGWGRLNQDNLFQVLGLHRLYANLMRRTPSLARARGSNLLAHILASIKQAESQKTQPGAIGPPDTALLILSGHDTNQSNVSGMLGLSWAMPGYQPDETPPGGALIFSLWRNPENGQYFVRLEYLASSLDQMRNANALTTATPPARQQVVVPGCDSPPAAPGCLWHRFITVMEGSIDPSLVER
jgi:4-phytase / acid phosphatase